MLYLDRITLKIIENKNKNKRLRSKAQRKYTTDSKFMIIFYFGLKIHPVHFRSLDLEKKKEKF